MNKNALKGIDLNQASFQYFGGVDLMKIEGLSHATVLTIMSEVGPDGFKKFETAKQFASWLRLAPNNKISGGKVLSNRVPKGSNRLKIALRNAANAIGNLKDTHLSDFFKRVAYRRGRTAAVSATARKLAVIIWNMISKKIPYNPPTEYLFLDQKRKMRLVERIRKNIAKLELKPADVGFVTEGLLKRNKNVSQNFMATIPNIKTGTMTVKEICDYFKNDVYKTHPEYEIEPSVIADSFHFYIAVRLGNDYCYCFLILPDNSAEPFEKTKPTKNQLKEFMQTEIFPNCVLKKVCIVKKNVEGEFEHRTFIPEHFEEE